MCAAIAPAPSHARSPVPAPALSVRGLVKRYADVTAVDGLDLDVHAGECFGLLGPNGAGKTTTIEICEGLTLPDAGEVVVLGRRWNANAQELRERLGIALQDTQLADKLTVEETLRLFASFYDVSRSVPEVIAMVSLGEKRSARVNTLSGGQKQRLAVACAMVGEPELLFLDEPTTGLDPQSRRQMWELVERYKATGRTVVLTTHYMEEAEVLCDRVAIVDHGKVIALGTPRALIASLGAEHVVDFTLAHDAEAPLDALAALPGVRTARKTALSYELQVGAVHESLPGLLTLLAARGLELAELKTHSPTLEDVFVGLTGRVLRDG